MFNIEQLEFIKNVMNNSIRYNEEKIKKCGVNTELLDNINSANDILNIINNVEYKIIKIRKKDIVTGYILRYTKEVYEILAHPINDPSKTISIIVHCQSDLNNKDLIKKLLDDAYGFNNCRVQEGSIL